MMSSTTEWLRPGGMPPNIASRVPQVFPVLTEAEIARMQRFGSVQRHPDGARVTVAGEPTRGMFVVLRGAITASQRDGLGNVVPIVRHGPGQFLGEVATLSGGVALVDAHAHGDVEALVIPPERLRALIVAEAELGERITRALILRRVALIEAEAGPVLIAHGGAAHLLRLQNFLRRNGHPHHVVDPTQDAAAAGLFEQYGGHHDDVLVVCPDGSTQLTPTEDSIARCLGMLPALDEASTYDVIVVGAGPAGLATAVYAASEGLKVLVLDCRSFGGQAGASARIENYLGFPTGISGQALAGRAYVQAQKFGARIMVPAQARSLDCERRNGTVTINLVDGSALRARTVVIASGAQYRRPDIPRLAEFEGHGVWYWASALEARMCAGQEVALVGGGNSAGQAAVFLSTQAATVHMLVRGAGLAATMSRYLIDRIGAAESIELHPNSEITRLHGDHALQSVTWRDKRSGTEETRPIGNVFLFVGADPETGWLENCGIALDRSGFVVTGQDVDAGNGASPSSLESSVPGVFAVGDVRSGSVKRVGAAIGEGAAAVAQIHGYMARGS